MILKITLSSSGKLGSFYDFYGLKYFKPELELQFCTGEVDLVCVTPAIFPGTGV